MNFFNSDTVHQLTFGALAASSANCSRRKHCFKVVLSHCNSRSYRACAGLQHRLCGPTLSSCRISTHCKRRSSTGEDSAKNSLICQIRLSIYSTKCSRWIPRSELQRTMRLKAYGSRILNRKRELRILIN